MPVHKYTYRGSARTAWFYKFNLPGSTRENRNIIRGWGFATKKAAEDAERDRYADELHKLEAAQAGVGVVAPIPKTLATLLEEFFVQHATERLAPKTIERYHQLAACLSPELVVMPVGEITPLHLAREWGRLLKGGGHHRRTKEARPLSAKTVRHVAGLLSSAFARAIRWGLIATNPVTNSEPPHVKKHRGIALTPEQQAVVMRSASGPWCLATFLEVAAATGARRGEVLALQWSDIHGSDVVITRSLTQTKAGLEFKAPKTEDSARPVSLPASTLAALDRHRQKQAAFRAQFGPDYRADLDLIFANPDGTPLKPDSISSTVSLLFRKLKLPKGASLHSLRHTHASLLLADGVDLATVSERLGHSSVRVTADVYSHAIRGRDQDAARRWDKLMRPNGESREEPTRVN
jgi:integrase